MNNLTFTIIKTININTKLISLKNQLITVN